MSSLFSPRDTDDVDDLGMSELQELAPIPRPDNDAGPGELGPRGTRPGRATPQTIPVREGPERRITHEIRLSPPNLADWNNRSLHNLAYLGQAVANRVNNYRNQQGAFAGLRIPAAERVELDTPTGGWGPGVRQLASWIDAANTTVIPRQFERIFNDAEDLWYERNPEVLRDVPGVRAAELLDDILGGAVARPVNPDPYGTGLPYDVGEPLDDSDAIEAFLNLPIFNNDMAPPAWLVLNGKWLTAEPKGKKIGEFLATLGEGQCSLRALIHAKAAVAKDVRGINPADWTGAPVRKMVEFLNERRIPSRFFDGMGRLVYSRDWAGTKHKVKFLVAGGHVMAFTSPCSRPDSIFSLASDSPSPMAETYKSLCKHFGLRSAVSIWNKQFYETAGIRAPHYGDRSYRSQACYDMNKSYPSIMTNPDNIFPISNGGEVVRSVCVDGEARLYSPNDIVPHGFYLCNVADIVETPGCSMRPAEEMVIMSGIHEWAWMYGDALLRAYPLCSFRVREEFVCDGFTYGAPLSLGDGSETAAVLRASILVSFPADEQPTEKEITARFYRMLTQYSGMIESTTSSVEIDVNAPLHQDEWGYYDKASAVNLEMTPFVDGTGTEPIAWDADASLLTGKRLKGHKARSFSTAGQLAKLAIYSYTRLALLGVYRAVLTADPNAYLVRLATDSISFEGSMGKPLSLDTITTHLTNVGILTDAPGGFKPQDTKTGGIATPLPFSPCRINSAMLRSMAVVPPVVMDLEDVYVAFDKGTIRSAAIFGPPGSGKTSQALKMEIIPSIRKNRLTPVLATKTLAHAERLGGVTLGSILSPKNDSEAVSRAMASSVIIVDEAGMSSPSDIANLRDLNPAGLVLVGDPRQLSTSGCLIATCSTLKIPVAWTKPHGNDRFKGDPAMRRVLAVLETTIDQMAAEGVFRGDPLSVFWKNNLDTELKEAGLPFVDSFDAAVDRLGKAHVLGYRKRFTYESPALNALAQDGSILSVNTVHKAQGQTLDGPLIITDFRTDPRLLYTAVSRATALKKVAVIWDCEAPGAMPTA